MMSQIFQLIKVILFFLPLVLCRDDDEENIKDYIVEYDIILSEKQKQELDETLSSTAKNAGDSISVKELNEITLHNASDSLLWPNNTLYYAIAENQFTEREFITILRAMRSLESKSCVKFRGRKGNEVFIIITNGVRCASRIGYFDGTKPNKIYLSSNCISFGTVVHELLHTLGLWHEHSRLDRDKYLEVQWQNIPAGEWHNFFKRDSTPEVQALPFDYNSLMLFTGQAFAKDGYKSILPLNPSRAKNMGQIGKASIWDLAKLNALYSCPISEFVYKITKPKI